MELWCRNVPSNWQWSRNRSRAEIERTELRRAASGRRKEREGTFTILFSFMRASRALFAQTGPPEAIKEISGALGPPPQLASEVLSELNAMPPLYACAAVAFGFPWVAQPPNYFECTSSRRRARTARTGTGIGGAHESAHGNFTGCSAANTPRCRDVSLLQRTVAKSTIKTTCQTRRKRAVTNQNEQTKCCF